MSFYGRSFLYGGIASEIYGLYIMDINSNAINESMGSSSMKIIEQEVFRRPTPYLLGMTPIPKLSFGFSAFSESELDAEQYSLVQRWLFSPRVYTPLAIDQVDMQNIYFNCIFNDPKTVKSGSLIQGFSATVECDSPFGWFYPQTTLYSYSSSVVDADELYYNGSDDSSGYLYPTLTVTMNDFEGDFSITNADDANRVSSFVNLQANEVLNINCSLQTISSSTGLKRLGNSNKKFLRLVPGRNRLNIVGNVASISMVNRWVAKKVSG